LRLDGTARFGAHGVAQAKSTDRHRCARQGTDPETTLTQYALKHRHRPTLPPSFCLAALSLALLPCAAQASAQLQCTFEVNSEIHHTVHQLATDPYTVAAVPIGNRFRFKAIVLAAAPDTASSAAPSAPTAIESVNLYVYYNTRRQPMVMQHTQYLQPLPQRSPAPDALTGRVAVYSPLLGKELQYHCALAEVAP
jgi:hypothetical protein